ncbi:DUF4097 family beta strand repeat-containing protein [Halobacterium litoreum]|uniref:DUF4097 family beta strand repeat-containing protein n=1 Tax=Halobacterium litoreum TaxID=2039234 RepID=A0ABD5NCY4_9EURY|nr:DUF4097 family beta strand repeat-containing protein [Halobacterium litoreum]UHH13939.1 DUF4097 domain-containing protein [Halobacterium litoreum]
MDEGSERGEASVSGCLHHPCVALDSRTRELSVATNDRVSVHTPDGAVSVERGGDARVAAASRDPFSIRTWREDGGLNVAVERDHDRRVYVELTLPAGVSLGSASTGCGAVSVEGVAGTPVVETGRGNVSVRGTDGVAAVRTGSGDVDVSICRLPDHATVETADGDATLTLADDLDATVELSVQGGDVAASPQTFDELAAKSAGYVRGVLGDGDAWLTAKTGGGDGIARRT